MAKLKIHPEVEDLFAHVEKFVVEHVLAKEPHLKIQVEKDFRGRPVLSVRVRKEDVEFELMPTLRYPE